METGEPKSEQTKSIEIQVPVDERLLELSPAELAQLREDALGAYSELEVLIHSINRLQDAQQSETLF